MGLLTPLVHKCDEGVQAALDSQAALSQQIDRVTTCPFPRAHAARSYALYLPLQQLHPTSNRRPPPSPSPHRPHRPTASLRRSQPSCRRFSARRRSRPSHRTRRSCRVCAGESLRRMARCSRYRLDSRGSTAWRSGSKRDSTTRCGRFLCRSRQVRMPGPAGGPAAPMARGRASTQLSTLTSSASRTSVVCCSYVVLIHEHVLHHGSRFRARARTHTPHRGERERARAAGALPSSHLSLLCVVSLAAAATAAGGA